MHLLKLRSGLYIGRIKSYNIKTSCKTGLTYLRIYVIYCMYEEHLRDIGVI